MESNISTNLKKLIEMSHMSATELSRKTGVKQPIIHRLLTGENENPKLATLKPIADYFMLTVSQLMDEEKIEAVWEGLTIKQHQGWTKVPLVTWNDIPHALIQKTFHYYVLTDNLVSQTAYAISMEDHSMIPVFPKNCLIIVEPQQMPLALDYVVVNINQEGYVIRQYITIGNKKYITPLNRSSGTISELSAESGICGVVVRTIFERRIIPNHDK